ncbi:MAG: cytochrome c biogenesis protein CcdA [Gemmatimonadetes bacterium]|nr:cytochrome c biogenesis protein CcdA [Gemmatimonadota bacterium]MBP6668645.1 cytochrome c biogenesis protein CcdA [Gemmatimonadales bacterium]MBK6778559.1 cytochrome c biogenesis protein CcdA [Gemmatimonadota bacterium]MBK7349132.1 cytochrome c biogenesis protein CcdA [Gemmatimonadota bacterium]MBK7714696.1 cytochrome c biogenesis protein CcdA [Gemmatimonadota bacterium]
MADFSLLVAFSAGILSFLSPCVLPLVPSYIGFLTGLSLDEMSSRRRVAFTHALLFVLGFTLVFLLLGATASALGRTLAFHKVWLQRLGGVLIIVFGLVCLGVIKSNVLLQDKRVHLQDKPLGFLGSVLVGMAFAAGWTPCIGPILGGILGLASAADTFGRGMLLLGAYSAGLAVPFLLAAWAVDRFLAWFQKFRPYLPWVMRVSGLLLIVVGVLLITGQFTRLAGFLQGLTPAGLLERL